MELEDGVEEVTEAELLQDFGEQWSRNLYVAFPVKVEAFNKDKQTVDVIPQLNRSLPDGAGNYITEALPKIQDIPVSFHRVAQFLVAFPIAAGDFGMVIVCDRNLAQWRATAAQGDPGDLALHSLDGAVFFPGLFPDSNPAQNVDNTNMVVGSDTDGDSRIEIKPSGGGNLGAGATEGIARLDDHAGGGTITFVGAGAGAVLMSVAVTYVPGDGSSPQTGTITPVGTPVVLSVKEKITSASTKWNAK